MTPEELLKPRYKVIADWPGSEFETGDVLAADNDGGVKVYEDWGVWRLEAKNYPHLFRKLEWWEERDVKDMPEYVKDEDGKVGKLGERMTQNLKDCVIVYYPNGNGECSHLDNWIPATKQEYLTYLKSKQ